MEFPYPVIQYALDLKGNLFDSLNEALDKIDKADGGDLRAYKFAVLNFTHFLELLLKFRIYKINSILIFKGPFSDKLQRDRTITLMDSKNFLLNCELLSQNFASDIEIIAALRNKIEHYDLEINTHEIRLLIARLARESMEFYKSFNEEIFEEMLDSQARGVLQQLSDEMNIKILEAERKAREVSAHGPPSSCAACGMQTASMLESGRLCHLCGHFDKRFQCFFCGKNWFRSNSLPLGRNTDGAEQFACEECAIGITCGDQRMIAAYYALPERYDVYVGSRKL
jgi:hypothetical protein